MSRLTEAVLLCEIKNNPTADYTRRIIAESNGYLYGELVNWDREKMIQHCLNGPGKWLGREVFEESYDDGSMKHYAMVYHNVGLALGVVV